MEGGLHVMCGRLDGVGVGLPAQGPHLCLHLRGAARHPSGAYLQVDSCAGELSGEFCQVSWRVKIAARNNRLQVKLV